VEARQMVATVKIIPFSARDESLRRCEELAQGGGPLLRLAPFGHRHAGFIQTTLPSIKASVLDKTVAVTKARLAARHADMTEEIRCPHEPEALAEALRAMSRHGHDSILVFAASATTDRRDVVPSAIVAAGGEVERLGMPVDPGNLLVLGRIGTVPVIGLPGCARSPKMNGFDWVLDRLCAGLAVTATDIAGMGAGGLLKEIETRPQPRDAEVGRSLPRAPRIAALVLAAGRSSRMGGPNKMLEVIDGKPMVAAVLDGVLASQARPVVMVTGHMADAVGAAIGARPVTIVRNPDFAHGLSTSLRAGLDALPGDIDGVLVCLGDMPMAGPAVLDRLIAAFAPQEGRAICVPTHDGKRGNPVLWAARFIPEMRRLVGDVGARHLIGEHADLVAEVAMESAGVLIDLDTPESLAAYRAGQRAP
ncbi:MAG: 4-diphosphocytidyl-2C-methyl-D-erythritol kinase, partial [Alphaproteobacteria bacterium]|nr:4-diphosphocytidyl-2C-methyl-D-erythritol kinase [Alphaproteobacteria bacterium]